MKVSIVAGGAGFLGSHLVDALVRRGESVIVLDNMVGGHLGNLERAISSGRVTFIYADVLVDVVALRALIAGAGVSAIRSIYDFTFAGNLRPFHNSGDTRSASEFTASLPLIAIALEHRAQFIYASDYSDSLPDTSTSASPREGLSFPPWDSLGDHFATQNEVLVAAAIERGDLSGHILRFFELYGPRMRRSENRLIPVMMSAISEGKTLRFRGDGSQRYALTYVDDVVKLILLIIGQRPSAVPIDVSIESELTLTSIAHLIASFGRSRFDLEFFAEPMTQFGRRRPDLSRARAIGWVADTLPEDGLRHTYEWFSRESSLFV